MNYAKLEKKKIIVIGCPGAGKSFFSRELRELTGIPVYYMDCIFWKENWEHLEREELRAQVKQIMEGPEWIIDGNYEGTLEDRYSRADLIFFLDVDEEVCIESEAKRRGTKREDLPEFLVEEYDPEFIEFIKNYKNSGRLKVFEMMEKYPEKEVIVFKTRVEKDDYINCQKALI